MQIKNLWRKSFIGLCILLLVPVVFYFLASQMDEDEKERSIQESEDKSCTAVQRDEILKKAPFVVRVYTKNFVEKKGGESKEHKEVLGSGTGFIYQEDNGRVGIYTAAHLFSNSDADVWVKSPSMSRPQKVKLISRDTILDVALLSIPPGISNIPSVSLAENDTFLVDDAVYAIGYQRGKVYSIKRGYVNALTSTFSPQFLSSQAPVQRGFSGGPLIRFREECDVELVGLNVSYSIKAVLALSARADHLKRIIPRLWKADGGVKHPYLGMLVGNMSTLSPPLVESLVDVPYESVPNGIFVGAVIPGSPAHQAGFRGGEIIRSFSYKGKTYSFNSANEFNEYIFFERYAGDEIEFELWRNGKIVYRSVTLAERSTE